MDTHLYIILGPDNTFSARLQESLLAPPKIGPKNWILDKVEGIAQGEVVKIDYEVDEPRFIDVGDSNEGLVFQPCFTMDDDDVMDIFVNFTLDGCSFQITVGNPSEISMVVSLKDILLEGNKKDGTKNYWI